MESKIIGLDLISNTKKRKKDIQYISKENNETFIKEIIYKIDNRLKQTDGDLYEAFSAFIKSYIELNTLLKNNGSNGSNGSNDSINIIEDKLVSHLIENQNNTKDTKIMSFINTIREVKQNTKIVNVKKST